MTDAQMPERIWLDAATYNGAVGFAHAKRKDEGQWQEFLRADLCASGPVRALEWSPSKTSYTQANCVLGQYQITFLSEFECWQLSAPHKQGTDWKDGFTRHASKSAAKAAAQADYERRILAALSSTEEKG